mmetsp:Transcript_9988/g.13460  ORF Transcript_9988/g.13460 Transcript_9988/m.13460 type:complete len:138 (-) Transcript_9988:142-555(-)
MAESTAFSRFFIIFFGSLINLIALTWGVNHSGGVWTFCLICAIFSMVLCLVMMILARVQEGAYNSSLMFVAIFLFLWWILGVGFETFAHAGPFGSTGNGYFSAWICFIFSSLLCADSVPQLANAMGYTKDSAYQAVA